VRQQLRKTGTGAEWTGSVLARAEQERRLALLAREAVAHLVRDGDVTAVAAEGVAPSSGLPTLKVAGTSGFFSREGDGWMASFVEAVWLNYPIKMSRSYTLILQQP